jgi:TolB protein
LFGIGTLSLITLAPVAKAQDPARGVSLGLSYRAGQKSSLLVLPVDGPAGDSVTTILARDLDFSDRFTMVPAAGAGVTRGPVNYPLLVKLGVDGIVQGTMLPSGWLRITLLAVAKKAILNQKDLPLPVPIGSPAWSPNTARIDSSSVASPTVVPVA